MNPADRAANERLLRSIAERAKTDPAFRQKCLTDPNAAIKEATGLTVPAGFVVRFFEQGGADLAFVLPDLEPAPADDELSEEDLEQAAGGQTGWWGPPPPDGP